MLSYFLVATQLFLIAAGRSRGDDECGKRPLVMTKRIIGGQEAVPNSWPWQAEIMERIANGSYLHKCGGSLIKRNWIVTAAHCLFANPDPRAYQVVLGEHRRHENDGTEQTFDVSTIHLHDRFFTDTGYGYDIAVMKLAKPAKLNMDVGLVCLPKQNDRVAVGQQCCITGWGATFYGPDKSKILREACKMPVVNQTTCSNGNSWFQPVDEATMVCAGFGGDSVVSGCNGDSGGPLVCEEERGTWTLRGAVSWGDPKCRAGSTYSVFARISSFIDWIHCHTTTKHVDLMYEKLPGNSCRDRHDYCQEWKEAWGCCDDYFRKSLQLYCAETCGYCGAKQDPCQAIPGNDKKRRSIRQILMP